MRLILYRRTYTQGRTPVSSWVKAMWAPELVWVCWQGNSRGVTKGSQN